MYPKVRKVQKIRKQAKDSDQTFTDNFWLCLFSQYWWHYFSTINKYPNMYTKSHNAMIPTELLTHVLW